MIKYTIRVWVQGISVSYNRMFFEPFWLYKMKRICEFCKKEYEWIEGQINWGKDGLKHGKGSVDCKKYCCYQCGKEAYKQHCKETNLKRYGVVNTFQVPEFKEKAKQTWIKKYGVDNSMKAKEVQQKSQETCMKHYGVKFPAQNKESYDKVKATCLEKYGVTNSMKLKETQNKVIKTKTEKYGDPFYNNPEKFHSTMMNKYGVVSYSQTEEYQEKSKKTCLEKYGVEYSFQSDNNKEKSKKTRLEKYGDENYSNREQAKKTIFEKYGVENPFASSKIKEKCSKTMEEKYGSKFYVLTEEFKKKAHISKKNNGTYGKSKDEEYIDKLLCEKFDTIKRQYVSDVYPFDCDFYIPSLDLYIEYQGFWTHGKEPYNENNPKHMKKIELWQNRMNQKGKDKKWKNSYYNAIHVWTVSDPLKRKIAKENNLNWKEFWSVNEVEEWLKTIK